MLTPVGMDTTRHSDFQSVDFQSIDDSNPAIAIPIATALLGERSYAYAITDPHIKIRHLGGADRLWLAGTHHAISPMGAALWEIAPELQPHQTELRALITGDLSRFEIPSVHRGERADVGPYVALINVPYRDKTGQIVGILHCVEDITDAMLMQQRVMQQRNELSLLREQLAQQNDKLSVANIELERLDHMKSIFVSTAAHELRTPVAAIFGYTEMMLEKETGPLTAEQQQFLSVIERNARRLLALSNNLLDITQLETGYMQLSQQPADLLTLAESAAEQVQPTITVKNQRFILDASPELLRACCDPARTVQVMTNLLSNASKYTAIGGTITLRLANEPTTSRVQIVVQDTGVGIPEEDRNRLFDRFFRASNVQNTDSPGVGLGLYIVKMLVELQGGAIWFDSEVDRGTTFYVALPSNN